MCLGMMKIDEIGETRRDYDVYKITPSKWKPCKAKNTENKREN